MKRILFLAAQVDASALYRMQIPSKHLENAQVVLNPDTELTEEVMDSADVVVCQRLLTEGNLKTLKETKEKGKVLVYDLDDNLWNIPAYNPVKKYQKEHVFGVERCMSACDIITVSTTSLRSVVQMRIGKQKRVEVLENAIDLQMFKPIESLKSEVVIGWGGSITHIGDVRSLFRQLPDLIKEYSNVFFEIVANELKPEKYMSQIRQRNRVPIGEYPRALAEWDWDIFLAPLQDNQFNRCKSPLKMIEAGAMKKPCLASEVRPYMELVQYDKELEWLICRSDQQWKDKIRLLVNDYEARKHYGQKLHAVVSEFYNIEKNIGERSNLYQSL